jgi:hypothetical protein
MQLVDGDTVGWSRSIGRDAQARHSPSSPDPLPIGTMRQGAP